MNDAKFYQAVYLGVRDAVTEILSDEPDEKIEEDHTETDPSSPEVRAARDYASREVAEEVVDEIGSSGHNSRISVAQTAIREAFLYGVGWARNYYFK